MEVPGPYMIHCHSGAEWVLAVCDPLGKGATPPRALRGVSWTERSVGMAVRLQGGLSGLDSFPGGRHLLLDFFESGIGLFLVVFFHHRTLDAPSKVADALLGLQQGESGLSVAQLGFGL